MARWRERRGGGETDSVDAQGESSAATTPSSAAAPPHFFKDRQAAAAAAGEFAINHHHEPRRHDSERHGARRRLRGTAVAPEAPEAAAGVTAEAPALPERTAGSREDAAEPHVAATAEAPALPERTAGSREDAAAPRVAATAEAPALPERTAGSREDAAEAQVRTPWLRRKAKSSKPRRTMAMPRRMAAAAVATAGASVRGVGEVAANLRGQAASAMAHWQQRHPADGVSGRLSASSSELTRDVLRLLPAFLLCVIGIALTYGVCVPIDGAPERLYWRRQIAFLAAGLGLYAVIGKLNNVPVSRRTMMRVIYALLCVGLPVLVLLLGQTTGNGMRWLSLFGLLSIQPAEFAKIALIWVVAELVNPDQPLNRVSLVRRNLLALLAVAVPVGLVFMERSMGNTALLCLSVGAVLATRWFSWPVLMGLSVAGILGLAPIGRAIIEIRNPTPGINLARLEAHEGHLDPERTLLGLTVREVSSVVAPAGATGLLSHCPDRFACYLSENGGWNGRQALRCVRLGGMGGSGYRSGNITILGYLPRTVQHTDFIYCVLSESFGFWGGAVVLGLIAWLIVAVLWSGVHSRHPAAWSFSVGFATLLFLQTLIHVGMALRLLPIIGIPLPFVSYGGSFLVTSFAALGLVARYDGPVVVPQPVPVPQVAGDEGAKPVDRRFRQPDLIPV